MTRPLNIAAVLIVAAGIGNGICHQASIKNMLIVFGGAFYVLLPAVAVLVIGLLITLVRRKAPGSLLRSAVRLWCACAAALFLSWAVGFAHYNWQIYSVRSYVAKAILVLNKIKTRTGSYPDKLPVSELGNPPALLWNYSSGKDGLYFGYFEPGGWGNYYYCESDGVWIETS